MKNNEEIEKIDKKQEKINKREAKKAQKEKLRILKDEAKKIKKEQKEYDRAIRKNIVLTPWTKYYKDGVTEHLKYPNGTMVGYLLEAVARYPEDTAIEYYGRTYTYRTFYEMIRDTAKSLKAEGVKEGDKIAIFMPNTPQAVMMFYAANMIGAVAALASVSPYPTLTSAVLPCSLKYASTLFFKSLDIKSPPLIAHFK